MEDDATAPACKNGKGKGEECSRVSGSDSAKDDSSIDHVAEPESCAQADDSSTVHVAESDSSAQAMPNLESQAQGSSKSDAVSSNSDASVLDRLRVAFTKDLSQLLEATPVPEEYRQYTLCFAGIVLLVLLLRACRGGKRKASKKKYVKSRSGKVDENGRSVTSVSVNGSEEDLGELACVVYDSDPPDLRVEGAFVPAMENEPNRGLVVSNGLKPHYWENENCSGYFQELHVPTHDEELLKSGNFFGGKHFAGRKRLWESRVQMKFKKPPRTKDLLFGVELETYVHMSAATKRAQAIVTKMLKKVLRSDQVYHSPGDDPKTVRGEKENPVFTMPLYAFDQFIVTPPDQDPPSLTDPNFGNMGYKRAGRMSAYKKEIEELVFQEGFTYTFCFWGISRFLDKLHWELRGIPLITPLDFNKFAGAPPVHVVLYTVADAEKAADGKEKEPKETRHLQCRKSYYMNLACWPSLHRPPAPRVRQLFNLPEIEEGGKPVPKKTPPWYMACCSAR